jgi:hypothetical protein
MAQLIDLLLRAHDDHRVAVVQHRAGARVEYETRIAPAFQSQNDEARFFRDSGLRKRLSASSERDGILTSSRSSVTSPARVMTSRKEMTDGRTFSAAIAADDLVRGSRLVARPL